MTPPAPEKLQAIVSQGRWEQATAAIERLETAAGAKLLLTLPFEQQQSLYRRLPVRLAAAIAGRLPYYQTFLLLRVRPIGEVKAIVEGMDAGERMQFFEELPEEAWQSLMDELEGKETERISVEEPAPEAAPAELAAGHPSVPLVEARNIEKGYLRPDGGHVQVIAPTDLSVEPGMIVALLGPSGSGKSTLLRILTGLMAPSAGEVFWHGQPLAQSSPNIAIVFQSFALFPWLTVLENVEVPLVARGIKHVERHRRALKALATVGLKGYENAYPKELSGGMKQRAGFARALVVEPEILFMDEPFSALDVLTAENLRGELLELWLGKKFPTKSIFLVTHNIEEAVMLADRVIVLGRNPARIRADFRIDLKHWRDRNAAEFLLYVDYIYKLMTQPELVEPVPVPTAGRPAKTAYAMLPHARPGGIAGLIELLHDRGGEEDVYRIAEDLQLEVDDLLPILDAATLLEFAMSDKGAIEITEAGKNFAEADIATRKSMFRDASLAHVPLLQQMQSALVRKSDHAMPMEFFRDILDEHFSESEGERQIQTALNWGRYGDLFIYDADSDTISLHETSHSADAGEGIQVH